MNKTRLMIVASASLLLCLAGCTSEEPATDMAEQATGDAAEMPAAEAVAAATGDSATTGAPGTNPRQ